MAQVDAGGVPAACEMCEGTNRPLFTIPPDRRLGERAPAAVCRFCFIRLVGIVPRQRLRVNGPGAARLGVDAAADPNQS